MRGLALSASWFNCIVFQYNVNTEWSRSADLPGVRTSKRANGEDAGGGIQVINRAARILRSLRDEPSGLSLGQIAARVDLPRSTVQRIVGALVAENLLMHASPAGRVRLGTEVVALALSANFDVVELAHPHLKALSEATGETVDLAVLRGDHLVFVDQVVGTHRLRAVSAVGEVFPLHSTANGKACLSLFDEAEIRKRFGAMLDAACRRDGRSFAALLKEIARSRKSRIALDKEEHSAGISALGTAFVDPRGGVYAISIPMPTSRFEASHAHLAKLLLNVRSTLTDLVGK